jgi:acyl carrier protein
MNDLSLRIREIIADVIVGCPMSPEEMTPVTRLRDELGADSLDEVEISIEIEEKLGVALADEFLDEVKTVGDFIAGTDALLIAKAMSK